MFTFLSAFLFSIINLVRKICTGKRLSIHRNIIIEQINLKIKKIFHGIFVPFGCGQRESDVRREEKPQSCH